MSDYVYQKDGKWYSLPVNLEIGLQAIEAFTNLSREEIFERLQIEPLKAKTITTKDKEYRGKC